MNVRPLLPGLALVLQGCAAQPTCPSQELPAFLDAFAESVPLQRTFITYPLLQQRVDVRALPEPRTEERFRKPSELQFPLFPSAAVRRAAALEMRIAQLTSDRAQVTVFKPDADEQVRYLFIRNSCWRLERISDDSL